MKKALLAATFLFLYFIANAQTNVRAWYADGQVWVVWEVGLPLPQTYSIFAKPTPFANIADATPLGRLFRFEYLAGALKEQVDTLATYRIPDGQGGTYQLALNEGLFVATPHQAGALYIAVVADGETEVTAGINITDDAVPFVFAPQNDPVECHLQATFPSPFAPNFICQAYYMWCDGRQNHWEGRPDFPIMANAAKNGMPGFFFISAPTDLDTTTAFPLTVWLHGGGGTARQSLAGSRPIVGISPSEGLLLAHNDDLMGWRDTVPPNPEQPSWHYGWRKNWNPFLPNNFPTGPDTVINYTQRRYLWIDQWLIQKFNIDTARLNINGHSMGGAGTTALAKCFPKHYASATVFNNGFGGPENDASVAVFGSATDDFYTNLINRNGEKVKFRKLWNIIDNTSPERDWPPFRVYHSKNDYNATMQWDSYVVENYRKADSLGMGVQLYWSERAHGIDEGPNYNDHWHNGNLPSQQTGYDDTAYEETHFDSDDWLPAFFNHRLKPTAGDPGDGTLGTGPNGVGDDWGTWGGYHRWEDATIPLPSCFHAEFWLEDEAAFGNDNCPVDSLVSDLYIRRLPFENATFCDFSQTQAVWLANIYATDGTYNYSFTGECVGDELLKINDVTVFRKSIRPLLFDLCLVVPTTAVGATPFTAALQPNPATETTLLTVSMQQLSSLQVRIGDSAGRHYMEKKIEVHAGENRIPLDLGRLSNGFYFVQITDEKGSKAVLKLVVSQ